MNLRRELESGLQALALEYSPDQIDKLLSFVDDLLKWNKVYNLTAIRQPADVIYQHLLDSLTISSYIESGKVIDVGTGGGFPGIPLAIFHPETHFVLLDSNVKKTRFLQQMVINHQLHNCEVAHTRAESYSGSFDQVVCRAFASLPNIVGFAGHLTSPVGRLLAMKGQLGDEVDSFGENDFAIESGTPLKVPGLDAERHLVVLKRDTFE